MSFDDLMEDEYRQERGKVLVDAKEYEQLQARCAEQKERIAELTEFLQGLGRALLLNPGGYIDKQQTAKQIADLVGIPKPTPPTSGGE